MSGHEKLIPVREGDDWGCPCCASTNLPYSDECLTCSALTQPPSTSTAFCTATSRCSPKCDQVMSERLFVANDQNGEIFWVAPLAR